MMSALIRSGPGICFLVLGIFMILISKELYLFQAINCLNDVAQGEILLGLTTFNHF